MWIKLSENEGIRRSCLTWMRRPCLLRRDMGEERQKMCSNSDQQAYHCHSREARMESSDQ